MIYLNSVVLHPTKLKTLCMTYSYALIRSKTTLSKMEMLRKKMRFRNTEKTATPKRFTIPKRYEEMLKVNEKPGLLLFLFEKI